MAHSDIHLILLYVVVPPEDPFLLKDYGGLCNGWHIAILHLLRICQNRDVAKACQMLNWRLHRRNRLVIRTGIGLIFKLWPVIFQNIDSSRDYDRSLHRTSFETPCGVMFCTSSELHLRHGNARALNARATRDFHQQKKIDVLTRSALSPDIYGDIFKDDQDWQLQLHFVYKSWGYGPVFLWQLSTAPFIKCTEVALLLSTPMEGIHDTGFRSSFLLCLWCIVDKSIRTKYFIK